jgi:hypothetical protein
MRQRLSDFFIIHDFQKIVFSTFFEILQLTRLVNVNPDALHILTVVMVHHDEDSSAPKPDLGESVGRWNAALNESNRGQCDRSFTQSLRTHNVKRDLLDAFLQDTKSTVPSLEVEQTKRTLRNIGRQPRIHSQPARAWVESRRRATDHHRNSPMFLTPNQLSKFFTDRVRF